MKTALLAFDSPDLDMLQRGIDAGELPFLARLVEDGRFVALDDVQELLTTASWSTITRGTTVTDHLLLADRQLVPGSYRTAPITADEARRPPFWRYVSDAGLRSTVVSVYGAPLLAPFNGTQVVGWGSTDPYNGKLGPPRSDPPELIAQLEGDVGSRTLVYGRQMPRTDAERRSHIDECVRGAEQQAAALIELAGRGDWDLFVASFSDCHEAGHLLWLQANPDGPSPDAELRDGLMRIYRAVDAGLGALVERLPSDTAVLLTTPYAMGSHHHLELGLPAMLAAGGWLSHAPAGAGSDSRRVRALGRARALVQRTVPSRLRPALGRLVPRDRLLGELELAGIDWSRTRAFALPGDASGHIRFNLAGREPSGAVRAGSEYDELCHEIDEALRELVDAATGQPVVERVARFDELFGVEPSGPFPDLCVQWRRSRAVPAVRSERLGTVEVPQDPLIGGGHYGPGFLIGRAPGIPASGSTRLDGPSARLQDVAPTAMAWLGVQPPEGLSGTAVPGLAPAAPTAIRR